MATNNKKLDPGHIVGIFMILLILLFVAMCQRGRAQTKQTAVIDTMVCHNQCIEKFITVQTEKGKVKYFAVYDCNHNDVHDIIPVYASVMDYINTCKQYGIEPNLAIRLRNGVITNIIKYKTRYVKKSIQKNM